MSEQERRKLVERMIQLGLVKRTPSRYITYHQILALKRQARKAKANEQNTIDTKTDRTGQATAVGKYATSGLSAGTHRG